MRRPAFGLARALASCMLLAGCNDATDTLHDLGRVRATFYRLALPVAPGQVDMPGDRLVPSAPCSRSDAPDDGLFDPCRPDPDQPELDAYGLPRVRPAGPPSRPPPEARAVRPAVAPKATPVIPHSKPATRKAAERVRRDAGMTMVPAKPASKPATAKKPVKNKPKPERR